MPRWVERRWEGDASAFGGRRARQSFTYRAFVPDTIAEFEPFVPLSTADLLLGAEQAIQRLNGLPEVAGLEAFGPLLLRSESQASSKIEGYIVSTLELARALVDPGAARGSARVVAGNVVAMEAAIAVADRQGTIGVDDLVDIHRHLLGETDPTIAGWIRTKQNWIGGRLPNPADAAFVPPPPDEVPALLDDLVRFIARDDISPLAQAAVAHAQFETIHPFADGNGRVGRCLIHVILRRRGLTPHVVPPISVVLAGAADAYVGGLVDFREGRVADWCELFAMATARAADGSATLAAGVATHQATWRNNARARRGSAAAKIIELLPALPVLSARTVRLAIGTSHQAALSGLKALAEADVLGQISGGTYDRVYAAQELLDLVDRYQQALSRRPDLTFRELAVKPLAKPLRLA